VTANIFQYEFQCLTESAEVPTLSEMKSAAGLIKNHVGFRLNIFGSAEGGLLAMDAM
jgi:hypothetical protein